MLWNFLREEEGQDLIEYTLLLAFVALAVAALYTSMSESINSIWTKANGTLSDAATAAKSTSGN